MTAELWPQHGASSESWVCVQALQAVQMLLLAISAPHTLCERCCCQGAWPGQRGKGGRNSIFFACTGIPSALLLTEGGFTSVPLCCTLGSRSGSGISENICRSVPRILQVSEHSPALRQDPKMRRLCHGYLLKDVVWQKGKYGRKRKILVPK